MSHPDAYLLLGGWALHEPGTLVEAVAAYQKSLELKPGQLRALASLGDAYLQLGRAHHSKAGQSVVDRDRHEGRSGFCVLPQHWRTFQKDHSKRVGYSFEHHAHGEVMGIRMWRIPLCKSHIAA